MAFFPRRRTPPARRLIWATGRTGGSPIGARSCSGCRPGRRCLL